jgi:hypothetical protein
VIDMLIVGDHRSVEHLGRTLSNPWPRKSPTGKRLRLLRWPAVDWAIRSGPDVSYRAMTPEDQRYGSQADAVLYLGPGDT